MQRTLPHAKTSCARAKQILDEAQKQLGDQLDLRLARIRLWSQGGGPEPDVSIAGFTQGLGAWPVSSRVQLLRVLAETAARLGEGKQAERLWQQIAELEPRDIRSRASLLEITLEQNNPGRARTLITELRDLEGEQGMWWRYGAAALLTREGKEQTEKLDEARKMLDRLAAQHKDWGRVPLLRARIAETRGDPEGALVHYQEALRLGETNPRLVRTVIAASCCP